MNSNDRARKRLGAELHDDIPENGPSAGVRYTLEPIDQTSFGYRVVPINQPSAALVVTDQAAACINCYQPLPKDAHYCIECGMPVANTGKTERL
jgi:hypothetical protein